MRNTHEYKFRGESLRPSTRSAARIPELIAAVTVAGSSVQVASPARCSTLPTGVGIGAPLSQTHSCEGVKV